MIDMQKLLQRSNVQITLANEAGEFKYLGEPTTLRPTKTHYTMTFKTDGEYDNVHPFTMAVLHTGQKMHDIIMLKPTFMEGAKTVELYYS